MNFSSRRKIILIGLLASVALAAFSCGGGSPLRQTDHKVLVLGFDGMDPKLLANFMHRGEFPNFEKLIAVNGIRTLATSDPPQSPVAWSNFITGKNPGGHAIFDFIHRYPDNYLPYLSMSRAEDSHRKLKLGDYVIPLEGGEVKLLRKGTAFWELIVERDIPVTMFRIPSNFPPVAAGRSLSGMGTPDLLGGYGAFSFFTEEPPDPGADEVTGGEITQISPSADGSYTFFISGPPNTMLKERPVTQVEVNVWTDPENPSAKIDIGGETLLLEEGQWSDWVRVEFEMLPHLSSVSGICLVYLKSVHPHLQVYISPVNIDPEKPAMPISHPPDYAAELARETGLFYTQGMPEDTKALDHGVFTDMEYFRQSKILHDQVEEMFHYELDRFDSGLLFYYFSNSDLGSHMFWSAMDKNHPGYGIRAEEARDAIFRIYRDMDRLLGIAMERLNPEDTLIVMSDHGFASFARGFHLNSWLKENGFLALVDEFTQGEQDFFMNVDWTNTSAYGLGFNSLYVNQMGREGDGIVPPGAAKKRIMEKIRDGLLQVRDPKTGAQPITHVYFANEIYSGEYLEEAPDMIIGYNTGYRASWETAIGKIPRALFSDNDQKWTGDHCVDSIHVPGILMSNRKITAERPALYDLPVTILNEFGIDKNPDMIGRNVFVEKAEKQYNEIEQSSMR